MGIPSLVADNPAVFTGLLRAILVIAELYGLKITPEQQAALIVVTMLLVSFVTHRITVPKGPSPTATSASIQQPQAMPPPPPPPVAPPVP